MNQNFTKFAFTEAVKQVQQQYGSRKSYEKMERSGDKYILTEREQLFIASRDSFYMATVGENGWPYVQFRGGPAGFLKVLDPTTLAFADFRGNRQYISSGNIKATRKAALFLIDYPTKQRLKLWAEAEMHDAADVPDLVKQVHLPDYKAVVERVMVFHVRAWDWNCPQHITPRYTLDEVASEIQHLNPETVKSCCPEDADGS